jgi:hypothetical protein
MTANQTGPAGCLAPEADSRPQAIVLALCRTPILSPWPRSQAHKLTPHKPCYTSLHHQPNHQSQTTQNSELLILDQTQNSQASHLLPN